MTPIGPIDFQSTIFHIPDAIERIVHVHGRKLYINILQLSNLQNNEKFEVQAMRGIREFLADELGVENAVYSILMIAIVVVVALMIGSLVLSRGGELQVLAGTPKASVSGVLTGGAGPALRLNHESGDPLNVAQLSLSVFDSGGVQIGSATVPDTVTPATISSGMQTSPIPLDGIPIVSGSRYTIKISDTLSKQQIGMMVLVAR